MIHTNLFKPLVLLALLITSASYSLGVWTKEETSLKPLVFDFLLLKNGKSVCHEYPVRAWIGKKLIAGEKLAAHDGQRLGQKLKKDFGSSCVKKIELDIEPLTTNDVWIIEYLKNLKAAATPLEIHLAAYPHFTKEITEKILSAIDGIDWMVYDTGAKSEEEYSRVLLEVLNSTDSVMSGKSILIGLPAYYDKTVKHSANFENLKTVLRTLSTFKPKNKTAWCEGRIDFSIYAAWSMKKEDKALSQVIRAWKESLCTKS